MHSGPSPRAAGFFLPVGRQPCAAFLRASRWTGSGFGEVILARSLRQRFFRGGAFSSPCRVDSRGNGGRIAHHLRGGGFPYLPIFPIFPVSLFFPKSFPPFVPPPVFLHRVTRRSLFLPAGISGSVPASPAEKPRKLLFQNPEWLFSLRFFRISPGFSLSLKV